MSGPSASRSPEDAASAWYVRLQNPELPASERIDFRRWLDADPRHSQAFSDVERLWQALRQPARHLGASGWHRRGGQPLLNASLRGSALLAALLALAILLWSESARAPDPVAPAAPAVQPR